MALTSRKLDIEIDGVKLVNRIVEPTAFLSDDPHVCIVLTEEAFDHLLRRIREDKDMIFSFKASAPGLSIESEAKIEAIGYNPEKARYYTSLALL